MDFRFFKIVANVHGFRSVAAADTDQTNLLN